MEQLWGVPELQKANPSAFVEINGDDARNLGIAHGDACVVETRRDRMTLPAPPSPQTFQLVLVEMGVRQRKRHILHPAAHNP